MMTAETGTYRWMARVSSLQLYSTVTLRHAKRSTTIIRWTCTALQSIVELLHNRLPFEGMSNLQAAYAVAFKNVRPSADDLPEELASILTSCWKEDPNSRPNFSQIVQMLLHYLSTLSPPNMSILPVPTVRRM
ncbi:unnamed protein product [Musa acuminata subsp. burmannicoides]